MTRHILVIGGGIAGSSVAYWAAQNGHAVTLFDAGLGRASDVPSALINPVRGQNGHVVPRGIEGMRCVWALVDELASAGFAVPHQRMGVFRPLLDELVRKRWETRLPPELSFCWRAASDVPGSPLTSDWHSVLEVSDAGWLCGASFIQALKGRYSISSIPAQVTSWSDRWVTTDEGTWEGDAVVWCGGSWGATRAGLENPHRRGSLLQLDRSISAVPVSFGVYASPAMSGGVLGATFEAPEPSWSDKTVPLRSLHWLMTKTQAVFSDLEAEWVGTWTGSRLGGTPQMGLQPEGFWSLSALGSKGFLLGPMLAEELVRDIQLTFA